MLYDLIVQNGLVVLPGEVKQLDIGIAGGRIVALEAQLTEIESVDVIDASGKVVLPGMIDVHVHLNEPNLGHWEGFESGSAALAAGGCTTYLDMPLNGNPPTVNVEALSLKASLAKGKSVVDYGFWGGLVPGNLEHLKGLADGGVFAFKAFMSNPGGEGEGRFREIDDRTLFEGMKEISALGGLLAIHAESENITSSLGEMVKSSERTDARAFAEARPIIAECEAVSRALLFAEITGCRLHFVHISSADAVELIDKARSGGLDVTLETCPHYLVLNEDHMERLGAVAKCAPPLRSIQQQDHMWQLLAEGKIDMIASDHSPSPSSLKLGAANFFEAWGGISGAQSSLELMLHEGVGIRKLPLTLVAELLSRAPAKRFGLYPRKGEITVGFDADLAIVDLDNGYTLQEDHLLYRHKLSPYTGMELSCRISATISRGKQVYGEALGVFLKGQGTYLMPLIE